MQSFIQSVNVNLDFWHPCLCPPPPPKPGERLKMPGLIGLRKKNCKVKSEKIVSSLPNNWSLKV